MYASKQYTNISGFETVRGTGTVTAHIDPGRCVHVFVGRFHGYAIISKYNPTDQVMNFEFTAHQWYAYALNPKVDDVLTFFTNSCPFGVLADDWFDDYNYYGPFNGPMDKYSDMFNALSVAWSPGLSLTLPLSTETNIELYDSMFNFKFAS